MLRFDNDLSRGLDFDKFRNFMFTLPLLFLTYEDQRYLLEVFNDFDADKSGTLNHNELQNGMNRIGLNFSMEEINDLIQQVDLNEDSEIDFSEFLLIIRRFTDFKLRAAFANINGGEPVNLDGIKALLRASSTFFSNEELNDFVYDWAGDGGVEETIMYDAPGCDVLYSMYKKPSSVAFFDRMP